MMTTEEFKLTLKSDSPPEELDNRLQALWHDAKGNWNKAHNIAQEINSSDGSWIHAYLHRKEGDDSNASYWYSKAGRSFPGLSLEEEWEEIVNTFLNKKD